MISFATRPDLVKARQLVDQSGTRGARIVVDVVIDAPTDRATMADVVKVLNALDYRTSLRVLPATNKSFGLVSDPRNRIQAWGLDGWIAD